MSVSMIEKTVLHKIGLALPEKITVDALVKDRTIGRSTKVEVKRIRSVKSAIEDLHSFKYISSNDKGELWLLKAGKVYLGVY